MRNFLLLWTLTLLAKFGLASLVPISADEAYYWVWSQNLQLSYFDHPPMVSWLFWIGDYFKDFLGHSVRWPGVFLGHLIIGVWWLIWKSFSYDSHLGEKFENWFWLVLLNPLLGFGSLIITPDLPVLFFWSLSLFWTIRIFKNHQPLDYILLGASLGLGFCAKYHIVLFLPCLFLFILFEKKWKDIQWSFVIGTILTGIFFSLPVLAWNFQNDWVSFRFQLEHGFKRPSYEFYWTWSYIAGQILAIFPIIFWKFISLRSQGSLRMISYFAYFPLLFFLYSSFSALVEVNWPIVAYPAIFCLAAVAVRKKWQVWVTNLFWVLIYCGVFFVSLFPGNLKLPEKLTEEKEMRQLIAETSDLRPLYLGTYQMASYFWYFTNQPSYKLFGTSRKDFYDFLEESKPRNSVFFFLTNTETNVPDWIQKDPSLSFDVVKKIGSTYQVFKIQQMQP